MCTADQKRFKADTVFDSEYFLFMDVVMAGNRRKSHKKKAQLKTDPLSRNNVEQNLNTPPTVFTSEFVPSLSTLCFRFSH